MSLNNEQYHKTGRAASEPPSPTCPGVYRPSRMSVDPSGRYKGSHYDPNYREGWSASQGGASGYTPNHSSPASHSPYGQPGGQGPPNGYQQSAQGSPYARDNGYGNISHPAPHISHPGRRNTHIPTGPASLYTAPAELPLKPATPSLPPPPAPAQSPPGSKRGLAMDQESLHPPRSAVYAGMPDWGREEGEISSTGMSSPASARVHPSRSNMVPGTRLHEANGSVSGDSHSRLQRPPSRTETPDSKNRHQMQSRNSSRPTPLKFTPISMPPSVTTPTTSQQNAQSVTSSPAMKSPLDSLEKLRQFKEQVAASRKSVGSMSGPEMSKLAQVAETFLKSQDPGASADALEQLKKQMGSAIENVVQADTAALARPPSSVASRQLETPDRPTSRQAELKERLLALKTGRNGNGQSPHDQSKTATSVISVNSSPSQANGHTSGQKRDRDDTDVETVREDAEERRARAEAWQKAKDRERQVSQAINNFRQTAQRDPPAPSPQFGRGQSGVRRPSSSDDSSPPRVSRVNGEASRAPPAGRIASDLHHSQMARQPMRDREERRESYGDSPERLYDTSIDRRAAPRSSRSSSTGYTQSVENRHRPPSRGVSSRPREVYRADQTDRVIAHAPRQHDRNRHERAVVPASRSSHPPAPRRSIESDYDRPRYNNDGRDRIDQEPVSYESSPVKSERYTRAYEERVRPVPEPVRYARDEIYARPAAPPVPMPILVPALPAVDPATVHATLDILKAQIARLEQLVPVPAPAPSPTRAYELAYERDPYRSAAVAAVPPPQQASYRSVEYEERRREQPYVYETRRAASPPPPPREYAYEVRQAPPAPAAPPPPTCRRDPAPRPEPMRPKEVYQRPQQSPKEPYKPYQHPPREARSYANHHDKHDRDKRSQGYDNRSSTRGRGGHINHHSRGGHSSTRGGGSDRGGRGGYTSSRGGGGGDRGGRGGSRGGHRY